jgi:uncharacterized coiled-coil protein SlyX
MATEPENLVLEHLRLIRNDIRDFRQEVRGDLGDLKFRMTAVEQQVATLNGSFAGQSLRIDRIEQRLDRIERRLNLVEA